MSFFDPLVLPEPEEPEPVAEEKWVPPEWFGPPEGVIGGVVPYREVLHHDDRLAIWVDRVLIYPAGIMVHLELHVPGRQLDGKEISGYFPWALTEPEDAPWAHREHPTDPDAYFRFGVRYEDGRSAATTTWDEQRSGYERLRTDPPGSDDLILISRGGSGGDGSASVGLWIWPGPPDGPIELLAKWPAARVPELRTTVPAEAIEVGRQNIVPLWPDATAPT